MKKSNVIYLVILFLLIQTFLPYGSGIVASAEKGKTNPAAVLPILETTPSNGEENVKPSSPIEIKLDKQHKNYKKHQVPIEKERYKTFLNEQEVESVYDVDSDKIIIYGVTLEPEKSYKIDIKLLAEMNSEKAKSGVASYSYSFKTGEASQSVKRLVDKDGNLYEFKGSFLVSEITLSNDETVQLSDAIDLTEKNPLVSTPVRITLPEEKMERNSYIEVNVKFKDTPFGLLDLREEEQVAEWVPFGLLTDHQTTAFRLRDSALLVPIKMNEPQAEVTSGLAEFFASISVFFQSFGSTKAYANHDAEVDYELRKMFNIIENENDGSFEAELTYLLDNPRTFEYDGNPEYYYTIYEITGESSKRLVKEQTRLDNDTLRIKGQFESGVYEISLVEKDNVSFHDKFWKQQIFIDKTPTLINPSEIEEIAKKYAPILVINEGEEYYPVSFKDIFEASGVGNSFVGIYEAWLPENMRMEVPHGSLKAHLSYNGHSEYVINGDSTLGLETIKGSPNCSTVYYSYMERDERKFINYHFIYAFDPKGGTEEDPGFAAHNYDRESIVVELTRDNKVASVTTSGHLPTHIMGLEGDDYTWDSSRLKMPFADDTQTYPNYENHPILAIAKGAHAVFPVGGNYNVEVPLATYVGTYPSNSVEPAGLVADIGEETFSRVPKEGENAHGRNFILPNTIETEDFNQYNLEKIDLNQESVGDYSFLSFSGHWVDIRGSELVTNASNEPFPPFTEKEKFITEWVDKADTGWDFDEIPDVNKESREDVDEYLTRWLNTKTGTVEGLVKDAITQNPIGDATVSLYDHSVDTSQSLGSSTAQGSYSVAVTAGDNKNIRITKSGYMPVEYQGLAIEEGETKYLETVMQIPSEYAGRTDGIAKGTVIQADNGNAVSGATLKFRKGMNAQTGTVLYESTSNAQGEYLVENVETNHYTIEVNKDGFITNYVTIVAIGGTEVIKQIALSPSLAEGEVRIVLEWGPVPSDLDSHLKGPTQYGEQFHIYYGSKRYYENGQVHAELDLDDVTSYGPETVTIRNFKNGVYRYYVHDFSNGYNSSSTELSHSSAKIRVFTHEQYQEFDVPTGNNGTIWNVFNIEDGIVKPVNTFQ